MRPQVVNQIGFLRERLFALVAIKRFYTRVRPLVYRQYAITAKLLATYAA
jgi:hypothetical protein